MVETVKPGPSPALPAEAPASRAERRREQRRSLIIAACEDQLRESGLDGTTLASVGDRVGLSKGALYYYVDSRDGLLALVLEDALDEIRAEAAAQTSPDASPVEELRLLACAHVRSAVTRAAGPLIINNLDYLAAHARTAELMHEHELVARRIIERGVETGELRPMSPIVASTVLFGALNSVARTYDPDGPLDLDEMIDAALELTLGAWTYG